MQFNTKTVLASAVFGAVVLSFCQAVGLNHSVFHGEMKMVASCVFCAFSGAWLAATYSVGRTLAVRLVASTVVALAFVALGLVSPYTGLDAWVEGGPLWHSAVMGFLAFGAITAVTSRFPPPSKQP